MDEDAAPITIDALANDTDIDGDTLSISTASVDIGTVAVISNKLQYTAPDNTHGTATISYSISDGNEGTATGSVTITINSVNDIPVATNDTSSMDEDAAPITIDALANDTDIDGDTLSISTASVDIGTVAVISNKLQYTAPDNTHGTATISYTISDGNEGTATGSVTVTINSVNDVPVVINDTASMDEDAAPITIDALANDTDIDNDTLSISTASVDIGTVTVISNKLQYTAPDNTHGTATISYTISDGNEGTATGSVTVTINSVNDAPVVTNQSYNVSENISAGETIGTIVASDIESQNLTFSMLSGDTDLITLNSSTGVLTATENGLFDYESSTEHTVTISITDDGTPNETTTVTITLSVIDGDDPLIPVEDDNFGRTNTGQQDLSSAFMQGEFNDSIELNNNLYFVGYTNNTDLDIVIASYTNAGDLNTDFNENGTKTIDLGADESATAIIAGDGDLFIAFTTFDGTNTEACLMKMAVTGELSDSASIKCTTYEKTTVINDLAFTDNKIQAVGKYFDGNDNDSLWIKYDKASLDFESSPLIDDVSGDNGDDEAFAIKSFGVSELMVVGSITSAEGDKDALIRYLLPDGTDSGNFNGGSPMSIDLSGINEDDELFAIGGFDTSDFTAFIGGYATRSSDEKEAVLVAIDKYGDLVTNIGTEGITLYNIDGNSGSGNGGAKITGIQYEPINNQIILAGTTGTDANEQVYSARVNITDGELDTTYAIDGINIVEEINGKQFANAMSVDANDTIWIAGTLNDTNTLPFVSAINNQAELVSNFANEGYLALTDLHDESDDISTKVLQLSNGAQAGKYIIAATAEYNSNIKLVLTRLTENGEIDTSFSTNGQRTIDIDLSDTNISIAEQNNGYLMIAGTRITETNDEGFIAKLDQDGNLDTEFATDGIYGTTDSTSEQVHLVDVATDSSNDTIAVGTVLVGSTERSFIVVLTDEGVRKFSFVNVGSVTGTQNQYNQRVFVNNNDEIIVAGKVVSDNDAYHFAQKYSIYGLQEFYYSATQPSSDTSTNITAMLSDSEDNIYLIGNNGEEPTQAIVIKLLSSGEIDTSFADEGTGRYNLTSSANTIISDAVLDSAGKIILVGQANGKGVFARLTTDGVLDSQFGSGGTGYYESTLCDNTHAFSSIILKDDTQMVVSNTCNDGVSNNISISEFNFYADGIEP
jgi:uncharacterized delta-60 repeat protein